MNVNFPVLLVGDPARASQLGSSADGLAVAI